MDWFLYENIIADEALDIARNAGGKARQDAYMTFRRLGMKPCEVKVDIVGRSSASAPQKLLWHKWLVDAFRRDTAKVASGDRLYVQFSLIGHSLLQGDLIAGWRKRGIEVVFLIHDLETLRENRQGGETLGARARRYMEEKLSLRHASAMIVHNDIMKERLIEEGIPAEKIVSMGLFDYYLPEGKAWDAARFGRTDGVVVAGNLRADKSGFLRELPDGVTWNLFGTHYEDEKKENVRYFGAFDPDELPEQIRGGFGLVWDGPQSTTCSGAYGEYLRVNNPHKTSLYLAIGLPVIIWKEAALARLVEKEGLGFTVGSLAEIPEKIAACADEEYESMKAKVWIIGERLRRGAYLSEAVDAVQNMLAGVR